MQNESYPRRNLALQPIRRGSQQAGRKACADKNGQSFCGLWEDEEVGRRKIDFIRSRVRQNACCVGLRNYTASSTSFLGIHPTIDARHMLAGDGMHRFNADFVNNRFSGIEVALAHAFVFAIIAIFSQAKFAKCAI